MGGTSDADARTIDVRGKVLMPGAVDVHAHLDTPFLGAVTVDDHLSASVAAVCGGTTTYADYRSNNPSSGFPKRSRRGVGKASGSSAADFSFHVAIADPYDGFLADLPRIVADGAPSIKVFMAYKRLAMLDDGQLFDVCFVGSPGHGVHLARRRVV